MAPGNGPTIAIAAVVRTAHLDKMALPLCFSLPGTNISGAIVGASSSAPRCSLSKCIARDRHRLALAARQRGAHHWHSITPFTVRQSLGQNCCPGGHLFPHAFASGLQPPPPMRMAWWWTRIFCRTAPQFLCGSSCADKITAWDRDRRRPRPFPAALRRSMIRVAWCLRLWPKCPHFRSAGAVGAGGMC
jgi:hypothetical protein